MKNHRLSDSDTGLATVIAPMSGRIASIYTINTNGLINWGVRIDNGRYRFRLNHLEQPTSISVGQDINKGNYIGQVFNQPLGGYKHLDITLDIDGQRVPLDVGGTVWQFPANGPRPSSWGTWAETELKSNCNTAYKGEFAGQNFQGTMMAGTTQRVQVQIKNTGTATWDGLTRITALPRESTSPFYDPSWIAPTRIVGTESTPPGAIATFEFTLKAPATPGQYQLNFALLHEGVTWFSEPVEGAVSLPITVIPSYKGELVEQTFQSMMTIGSTQRVQIRIKNTGTATWDGLTRITALPRESTSPFYDPSWVAPTRIVGTESTPPGAIATFEFTLRAPANPGQYQLNFALLHEGVTWFSEPVEGAVSLPIQVTTTQDQERNVFLPLLKKSL